MSNLRELGALVALTHCLVVDLDRRLDAGETLPTMPPWHVQENKWRAARYGLDAVIILDAESNERLVTDDLPDLLTAWSRSRRRCTAPTSWPRWPISAGWARRISGSGGSPRSTTEICALSSTRWSVSWISNGDSRIADGDVSTPVGAAARRGSSDANLRTSLYRAGTGLHARRRPSFRCGADLPRPRGRRWRCALRRRDGGQDHRMRGSRRLGPIHVALPDGRTDPGMRLVA